MLSGLLQYGMAHRFQKNHDPDHNGNRILNGEKGDAPGKAMELPLRYAKVIKAERFCSVAGHFQVQSDGLS